MKNDKIKKRYDLLSYFFYLTLVLWMAKVIMYDNIFSLPNGATGNFVRVFLWAGSAEMFLKMGNLLSRDSEEEVEILEKRIKVLENRK